MPWHNLAAGHLKQRTPLYCNLVVIFARLPVFFGFFMKISISINNTTSIRPCNDHSSASGFVTLSATRRAIRDCFTPQHHIVCSGERPYTHGHPPVPLHPIPVLLPPLTKVDLGRVADHEPLQHLASLQASLYLTNCLRVVRTLSMSVSDGSFTGDG